MAKSSLTILVKLSDKCIFAKTFEELFIVSMPIIILDLQVVKSIIDPDDNIKISVWGMWESYP